MSTFNYVLPFMSQLLMLGVLLTLFFGRFFKDSVKRNVFVFIVVLLCLFVPVKGLSIGQWLRSLTGDLSMLTLVVFVSILLRRLFNIELIGTASRKFLLFGILLVGVIFYPLALGYGSFDPYGFGYEPAVMVVIMLMLSVIFWLKDFRDLAVVMLLPLLAYNFHLYESTNLWDYLLDPVVFVYAMIQSALIIKFNKNK